jgi:hypothetical protein
MADALPNPLAAPPREQRDERALLALLLLLALLGAWLATRDETPDLPSPVALPLERPAPRGAAAPVPDYAETLRRPLFSPDRGASGSAAPPPAAPVAVPEAAPGGAGGSLDGWTLVGFTVQDGRVLALLQEGSGTPPRRLRSGEELAGWTLAGTAGRRGVRFERDGETFDLTLPGLAGFE